MSEIVFQRRIIPIAVVDRPEDAVPLAEAVLAGGLDLLEITFRTADAPRSIASIRKALPKMCIGAGTLLQADLVQQAVDAGAQFGLAPGLNETVIAVAQKLGLPFFPGVVTPTEIERALALGCRVMKFFPAEASGGIAMLKAMAAPFSHVPFKLIPTGGITQGNLRDYLAVSIVGAVGGSWIVERQLIADKNWGKITELTAAACQLAAQVKP